MDKDSQGQRKLENHAVLDVFINIFILSQPSVTRINTLVEEEEEAGKEGGSGILCCLMYVPATCYSISGTDLLRGLSVLPH